jgi:hypothetical protein
MDTFATPTATETPQLDIGLMRQHADNACRMMKHSLTEIA